MRSLILCQACKQHIRSTEQHCPFCGAQAVAPETADDERRARGRVGGRAALFLVGAVTAGASVACEDENEDDDNDDAMVVPIYGSPIDDDDDDDNQAPRDAGVAADAGQARKDAGPPLPVPVYGIPIDRDAGRLAPVRDASIGDAATNPRDADLVAPVYGIPIDPRDSGAPECEGDALSDPARVPGGDGGRSDAGSACAAPADAGRRDNGRPLVVPVYGIPVDPGPRPKR